MDVDMDVDTERLAHAAVAPARVWCIVLGARCGQFARFCRD